MATTLGEETSFYGRFAAIMADFRLLFLIVPGLGILELSAHQFFAQRAPRAEEWRELEVPVQKLLGKDDLLLIAPEWASPMARQALGDRFFSPEEVARADARSYARALEVSSLGARIEETREWRVLSETESGRFTLRLLENPAPRSPSYRFVDHVAPESASVRILAEGGDTPCSFDPRARVAAGGLHGHLAFPRERFRCGARQSEFVGVTIADDQDYRPRRCIFAPPPAAGVLRLDFRAVPLGRTLRGYTGSSYFLMRDGGGPVELAVLVGSERIGSVRHDDALGFREFSLDTKRFAGTNRDVSFEVRGAPGREFCFTAESS
jgi:hypothetical protein